MSCLLYGTLRKKNPHPVKKCACGSWEHMEDGRTWCRICELQGRNRNKISQK